MLVDGADGDLLAEVQCNGGGGCSRELTTSRQWPDNDLFSLSVRLSPFATGIRTPRDVCLRARSHLECPWLPLRIRIECSSRCLPDLTPAAHRGFGSRSGARFRSTRTKPPCPDRARTSRPLGSCDRSVLPSSRAPGVYLRRSAAKPAVAGWPWVIVRRHKPEAHGLPSRCGPFAVRSLPTAPMTALLTPGPDECRTEPTGYFGARNMVVGFKAPCLVYYIVDSTKVTSEARERPAYRARPWRQASRRATVEGIRR